MPEDGGQPVNPTRMTRWFVVILVAVAIIAILWNYNATATAPDEININTVAAQIIDGEIESLRVDSSGQNVTVVYDDGRDSAVTRIGTNSSLEEALALYGVSASAIVDFFTNPALYKPWSHLNTSSTVE